LHEDGLLIYTLYRTFIFLPEDSLFALLEFGALENIVIEIVMSAYMAALTNHYPAFLDALVLQVVKDESRLVENCDSAQLASALCQQNSLARSRLAALHFQFHDHMTDRICTMRNVTFDAIKFILDHSDCNSVHFSYSGNSALHLIVQNFIALTIEKRQEEFVRIIEVLRAAGVEPNLRSMTNGKTAVKLFEGVKGTESIQAAPT